MQTSTRIILGFALILAIAGCNKQDGPAPSSRTLFNHGWKFILSADSAAVFGNDSNLAWEDVTLPHTPRIEPLVVNDQWQGTCWYRKNFNLPALASRQYFIRFEGAMNVADVWINGKKMIHHMGGYLPFTIDFTKEALPGQVNQILVKLDNTDNPITGPKPLKGLDYNTYGGLYRDIFLVVKDGVYITDPILENLPGNGGVRVTYPEVSKEKAVINLEVHIRNATRKDRDVIVKHQLISHDTVVTDFECEATEIKALSAKQLSDEMTLDFPKLWSPAHPFLYKLVTAIYSGGDLVDSDTTRIGIRKFKITEEEFRINGEKMFLRGVNRHQEYPYIGYALGDDAQYRDARKIKDAGFDYVRLSHYPQSPAFMDACDELGLLVLDAIPGWQYFNEDDAFQDQAIQTCRDMIRRDRNHPCVLAWEVSLNESWMPKEFMNHAIAAAREEYPGDQCFTAGWINYGYDIYLQARQHRLGHYEDPGKPYIVSEYGDWEYYAMNAGFEQGQWQDLLPVARSSRQPLGSGEKRLLQQATNIQEAHNDNLNTPAFADGYWVMYDYNRGYSDDLETSGVMSIYRLPKFSYYFFRSQRDPDEISTAYASGPMAKIASYWDKDSDPDVRVFSNCDEVELLLNGELIARQKPDTGRICNHLAHPPFTFRADQFSPGKLIARGYIDGDLAASDTVSTPGTPSSLELRIDQSGRSPKAGVNDAIFVYAIITDDKGTKVPINGVQVTFSVYGDATILNPGSADQGEAGIATALVRIGNTAGKIQVTATSENLRPAIVDFNSVK